MSNVFSCQISMTVSWASPTVTKIPSVTIRRGPSLVAASEVSSWMTMIAWMSMNVMTRKRTNVTRMLTAPTPMEATSAHARRAGKGTAEFAFVSQSAKVWRREILSKEKNHCVGKKSSRACYGLLFPEPNLCDVPGTCHLAASCEVVNDAAECTCLPPLVGDGVNTCDGEWDQRLACNFL